MVFDRGRKLDAALNSNNIEEVKNAVIEFYNELDFTIMVKDNTIGELAGENSRLRGALDRISMRLGNVLEKNGKGEL